MLAVSDLAYNSSQSSSLTVLRSAALISGAGNGGRTFDSGLPPLRTNAPGVSSHLQFDLDGLVRSSGGRQQDGRVRTVVFFVIAGRAARSRVVAGEFPVLVSERGRWQIGPRISADCGARGEQDAAEIAAFRHGGKVE